jgi:hypothetical protein
MPIDWDKIADDAAKETDAQFADKMSKFMTLDDDQINQAINEKGISNENLSEVLKVVRDATKSNEAKAQAIRNISNGVDIVIGVASKFI